MDRIPVFLNPSAGGAAEVHGAIAGDRRFVLVEASAGSLAGEVRWAADAGVPRLVVAGGDGTVSAAAGAVGARAELAVVPAGTLNHFARSLGIPTAAPAALDLAATGTPRPVDAAAVNGRLFVNNSSLGAYVSFVRARKRLEPHLGYRVATLAAGARTLARHPGHRVELEVDGETRVFHTPLLFLGVGERGLFPLRVAAEGRSGLHVLVVHGRRTALLLARALAVVLRAEDVDRLPEVSGFFVDRCVVRSPTGRVRVAADGEIVAMESPLEYVARPAELRVVTP